VDAMDFARQIKGRDIEDSFTFFRNNKNLDNPDLYRYQARIDHVFISKGYSSQIIDCKVIKDSLVESDHRMICTTFNITPIIDSKVPAQTKGFKEKDPLILKPNLKGRAKRGYFAEAASKVHLAGSDKIQKLLTQLEEDPDQAVFNTVTNDIYSHLYSELSISLGITKKKPPRDCSKPNKKTKWDEKSINLLRNIKNRARKVRRDWNNWKIGNPALGKQN